MRTHQNFLRLTWRLWIGLLAVGMVEGFGCHAAEAQAFGRAQITNTTGGVNSEPSINATGTRIAFISTRDLTPGSPGNADGNSEIFLFDTTTGLFTQITATTGGTNIAPSINAAGTRITFVSNRDLTPGSPGNADGNNEIFLFDTTTGLLTQITNTTGGLNNAPSINAAGGRIAFFSNRDLTPGSPGNADGNNEIFLFDTTTGLFTQITATTGGLNNDPSINAAGTRIAFVSSEDLTPGSPGNPDGNTEIFLFDTTTGLFTQITATTGGGNSAPSINAAGTRIAFASDHDLTPGSPGNADGNNEIFLFNTTTGLFTQITATTGGTNIAPSINAAGTRIAFLSNRDLTPGSPGNVDGNFEIFVASQAVLGDFDNDLKKDLAVYRSATGQWLIFGSATGFEADVFGGAPDDRPVLGDFDGDGQTDLAIYRPSTGQWFIFRSTTGFQSTFFGAPAGAGLGGDIPVPADFDGDGKTDLAIYRPATGQWFIFGTATGFRTSVFGAPAASGLGDIPIPADFDGDGKADLAVYRQSTGQWLIFGSATGFQTHLLGGPASSGFRDIPVPTDFDGDGKADLAIYRQSTGQWFVVGSTTGFQTNLFGGAADDTPVPGDFDGDGKADLAFFRNSTGEWFVLRSLDGQTQTVVFGGPGDLPLP